MTYKIHFIISNLVEDFHSLLVAASDITTLRSCAHARCFLLAWSAVRFAGPAAPRGALVCGSCVLAGPAVGAVPAGCAPSRRGAHVCVPVFLTASVQVVVPAGLLMQGPGFCVYRVVSYRSELQEQRGGDPDPQSGLGEPQQGRRLLDRDRREGVRHQGLPGPGPEREQHSR